jgi:hypothetical protein
MRRLKNILAGLFISATALAVADDNSPIIAAGDIVSLTNELAKSTSSRTIYLSPGEYDVTALTNAQMYSNSTYGKALLRSNKAIIKGLSGKPEDVIIKVDHRAEARILALDDGGQLHGVTMTGGNATRKYINYNNHCVAGAVLITSDSTMVSNCVFYGNSAMASGGVIAAPYNSARMGVVYHSVFYGNTDSPGDALVASRTTLRNCWVTNNVSIGHSDKTRTIYVMTSCNVYDTYFADNVAPFGCIYGGMAVGCDFYRNRQHNINAVGNHWNSSGGGAARDAVLSNCVFYGNMAYRLGGAVRGGTLYKCTVISNRVMYGQSEAYGGGIYDATLVEKCTVASNYTAGVGGGVYSCDKVVDSKLLYNCASYGGGAALSTVEECTIAHNVARSSVDYYERGGGGGGVYQGKAIKCRFSDNSSVSYQCEQLKDCDIQSSRMHAKQIDSCVIHNVENGPVSFAVGNVSYPDGFPVSNRFMFAVGEVMRNCLVTNCSWRSLAGDYVNAAFFYPIANVTSRVENCTFADNAYYILARDFNKDPIAFVNCALVGNRQRSSSTGYSDIHLSDCYRMVFSNCVYGVVNNLSRREEGYEDSACLELGTDASPRFVTWENVPRYTPKRTSPLRGKGLLLDWMTDDATDIAGNPRVRDGKVDVGCYQCWLDPLGFSLRVR